jgi:hypothetical protein
MNSMINNTEFNCDSASASASGNSSECDFDKNVYYVENGLVKRQKKDNKSRSQIAMNQTETREKKIADKISQLPKKMRAKLEQTAVAVQPGKSKIAPNTKVFHNRQKLTQDDLLGAYDEECLAEDDALNEAFDEPYKNHWTNYLEAMNEEAKNQEEERYQAYLEKKYLWDFPNNSMSQWDLMLLKDELQEYEAEFDAKYEESEQSWKVIYEDHKYELDHCRSDWTAKELEFFQEKVDEYEAAHGINQKCEPEAMWLQYGLTKEQYEANQEYEANCRDLAAYYLEPDYASQPQYGIYLESEIKRYEDEFNQQTDADAIAEDNNHWWIDQKYAKEAVDDNKSWTNQTELEEETYEEWCESERERQKDQDMDDCRQEMCEYINDDY